MLAGRYGWAWIGFLVLIGAVECLSAEAGSQEPSLLKRATRIASVKGADTYSEYCVWLSDHKVISVDHRQLDWHKPPVISFHNLTTGKTRRVPFIHCPVGTHPRVVCSADGRWALGLDAGGPEHDKVIGMDLQTGRTLAWPNLGNPYHLPNFWLSDSRHWLQFPTLEEGYFNVYSVDAPKKVMRLDFPDAGQANWRSHDFCLVNKDHLLIYDYFGINGDTRTKLDIREYRLLPSITLLSHHHLYLPTGPEIEAVSFSPAGDRIAWIAAERGGRSGLWVCKIDGTGSVEIGYIPERGWGRSPQLIWLPDGKRLSFVHNDNLYGVPVGGTGRDAIAIGP